MIVCSRCRQENPDGAQHCASCRAYLGWARQSEAPPASAVPPPPTTPPPPQPGYPQGQQGYPQDHGQQGYPQGQQQPGYPQGQAQQDYAQGQSQPGYPQQGYSQGQGQQGYSQGQAQQGYPQGQQQPGYPQGQPPQSYPDPGYQPDPYQAQGYPADPEQPAPGGYPQQGQRPQGYQQSAYPAPPTYQDRTAPPRQPPPRVPPPPPPPPSRRATNTVQLGRSGAEAPRRAERTIGISIAPPPTANRAPSVPPPPGRLGGDFEAVLPQEQLGPAARQAASRASAASTGTTMLQPMAPGEVRCRTCGYTIGEDRRFCRCGAILHSRPSAAQQEAAHARLPWYRRLGEMFGGGRDFRRSMRSANRGLRVAYDARVSVRATMFRATAFLAAFGLLLSQFGPWGGGLRTKLNQQVDRLRPHSYADVRVGGALTDPSTKDIQDFAVSFATDGDPGRAWAANWRPVPDNGQPCKRAGGAPTLVVTFAAQVDLARIVIRAGLGDGNPSRGLQARPHHIEVALSDGNCSPIELKDTPDPQQFDLKGAKVTTARITILDAYTPDGSGGQLLVALSEVTFQNRQ